MRVSTPEGEEGKLGCPGGGGEGQRKESDCRGMRIFVLMPLLLAPMGVAVPVLSVL